ncbi:hypothetical protein VTO42DRAFT_2888 [Malbranchea cinnamomea]
MASQSPPCRGAELHSTHDGRVNERDNHGSGYNAARESGTGKTSRTQQPRLPSSSNGLLVHLLCEHADCSSSSSFENRHTTPTMYIRHGGLRNAHDNVYIFLGLGLGAAMSAARTLRFPELPTTVLTSPYYDVASDPALLARWPRERKKRCGGREGRCCAGMGPVAGKGGRRGRKGLVLEGLLLL